MYSYYLTTKLAIDVVQVPACPGRVCGQYIDIRNGMSKIPSPQKIPAWVTARLSPEAYEQIEKKCKPLDVGTTSTELQAAFILGQQSVLKLLRDEIVISQ